MVRPYQSGRQLRRRRCGMGRGRMKFDGGVDFNQPRNSFYHVVLDAFHLSPFSLSLIHLFSPPPSLQNGIYSFFYLYHPAISCSSIVESCVAACTIETRGREGKDVYYYLRVNRSLRPFCYIRSGAERNLKEID